MVFLFLLFPRLPGPLWHVPKNPGLGRTGLADHMTPGSIAQLAESEAVVFRVQFEGEIPPAAQLYWRGPVLWTTDGQRWDRLRGARPPWFNKPPSHEALSTPRQGTVGVPLEAGTYPSTTHTPHGRQYTSKAWTAIRP